MKLLRWVGLLLMVGGCASARRLDALETRLGAIEAALGVGEEGQKREDSAAVLFEAATAEAEGGDVASARDLLRDLIDGYRETSAAEFAGRLLGELEVVGSEAGTFDGVRWLQGEADFVRGATLVVFWELWCPYCQRYLPAMQPLYEQLSADGLQVAGLTRLTRGQTEEGTMAFVQERSMTFAIGVATEDMAERFGVAGIPAAALVAGGEIVWRGHPAALDEATVRKWLPGRL